MRIDFDSITERMREIFVTKDIFELRLSPLEKGFYGVVSLILFTVIGAILSIVVLKGKL